MNIMEYHSTNKKAMGIPLHEAILEGLPKTGGLYVPDRIPRIDYGDFDSSISYPEFANRILVPFFDDPAFEGLLPTFCKRAFTFPIFSRRLNDNTFLLDLFQGPTLSFKDFGARFLSECITHLARKKEITILVATSGDTGSAVAAAFHQKPGIRVVILYPKGLVSKYQEHQITCWGDNVLSLAVCGTFDDCQRLVKSAFTDPNWQDLRLCTANSINIGRLLPQICHHAQGSLEFYRTHKEMAGIIVPSGNLGNITAAFWAKTMGFPIREIIMATNANLVMHNYYETGQYKPRKSIPTLANAMDVGSPSNFERLSSLYPSHEEFKQNVRVYTATDDEIRWAIRNCYTRFGEILCPHTATGYFVRQQLSDEPWLIAATAHPCKFPDVIEPVIGEKVPMAEQMRTLLARKSRITEVDAQLDAIREQLDA